MAREILVITLALLFSFSLPDKTKAKTIKGVVVDVTTNKPIENGLAVILQKEKVIASQVIDNTGKFVFTNINLDRFTLHVTSSGYGDVLKGPFLISQLDTFKVIVAMQPEAIQPEYVVADEQSDSEIRTQQYLREEGFYKRKEIGWGRYLAPEDLKGKSYGTLTYLLRQIPGLVFQNGPGTTETYPFRSINSGAGATPPLQIFLDGFTIDVSANINDFNPNDIAAVEFYSSSIDAPARFRNPYRTGGVLLLWTKR